MSPWLFFKSYPCTPTSLRFSAKWQATKCPADTSRRAGASLLQRSNVPVHLQKDEVEWVTKVTGVERSHLVAHEPGDVVQVGEVAITLVHTPGHTPGSQCFLVDGRLVSGDTLFLDGCGRTDLPGSNPEDMYDSLQTLAALPDDTVIFPGHQYSHEAHAAMGRVRTTNAIFKPKSKEAWLGWFGG